MDEFDAYRKELADCIGRHMKQDGVRETAVPSLFFIRQGFMNEPKHILNEPSICVVAQGAKEICLADERFQYGPSDYLISSAGLPVTGQVTEASADVPYLSLKLAFTADQIAGLIYAADEKKSGGKEANRRAMSVCRMEKTLMDAVARLVRLVDAPDEIPVLAPLYTQEIFYRILQGPYGSILKQFVLQGAAACRIREVAKRIVRDYNQLLRVEELAKMANMSVPTFHRSFKAATAMSPVQFQKQLRLQAARRLLMSEPADVAGVAFRVGYESPSQFSREYSRLFGLPPKEDIKAMRARPCLADGSFRQSF